MRKYLNIIIIVFLSVICLIPKINALTIYENGEAVTIPDLPSAPTGYNSERFIIIKFNKNSWYPSNTDGYAFVFVPNSINTFGSSYIQNNVNYFQITFSSLGQSVTYRPRMYNLINGAWSYYGTTNQVGTLLDVFTSIDIYTDNTYTDIFLPANSGLTMPQLTNFTKITIDNTISYLMLSDKTKGSFYMPYNSYQNYGARFSYFNPNLSYQLWNSNIEKFSYLTTDLIRIDFDISSYEGASSILFQSCDTNFYPVACDNFSSYDIYIPNDMYYSNVIATTNQYGGYDYDYSLSDNGTITDEEYTTIDYGLSSNNPLLGTIFENFSSNTFGLTSIITSPLNLIQSITSDTCNNLVLPIPFTNSNVTLPCMTSFYENVLGHDLFNLYQVITFGLVSYWVIVRIFNLVKDFKNPDHDEIEVMDL